MRRRPGASGKAAAAQATQAAARAESRADWPGAACVVSLLAVRLASAALNSVHDCDEVYNYWEPLHNLLHGFGLQTWENRCAPAAQRRAGRALRPSRSPQFALRSYLYLLLHALFAAPASLALGANSGKRLAFHVLRGVLGVACALAEAALCRTVAGAGGRRLGLFSWALLLGSSGMFTSSTTLLPSTFTMVAFTAGAALSLSRRHKVCCQARLALPQLSATASQTSVAVCVAGGLLGWPFAGLAAVPLGVHALWVSGLLPTLAVAALTALAVLVPSAACDVWFYGRPTVRPCMFLVLRHQANSHPASRRCRSGTWFVTTSSVGGRARFTALKGRCTTLATCSTLSTWRLCWRPSPRWCAVGG